VVGSDNLLPALISVDAFTARILQRLALDVVEVGRVLTPPQEVRGLSEVQLVRAEKRKALPERDYPPHRRRASA
jgi:hypothetical protein